MKVAAAVRPDLGSRLVAVEDDRLQPVEYDAPSGRWRSTSEPPWAREDAELRRPFEPMAVIAPGPRITDCVEWGRRHAEYHVKPPTVLAPSRSSLSAHGVGSVVYRVQTGLVFRPTPKGTDAGHLLRNLIGCHLIVELVSCVGFRIGWEGPRWHIRYGEGMSFDGACPASEFLVTPDELDPNGVIVEHADGVSVLGWSAITAFAAYVNRYLELRPELMILGGWPRGPSLDRLEGIPTLTFDAPTVRVETGAWAESTDLGRVECQVRGETS